MLEQLEFEIRELDAEIHEYEHYMNCEVCLVELQLNVERYLGTRGPWFLDYQFEEVVSEFPDCPKAEDYKIGSYRDSSSDTIRFIKDRLAWAIKFTEKRFKAACRLIHILENWPTSRGIPEVSWLTGMIDELAETPSFFWWGERHGNHKKPI